MAALAGKVQLYEGRIRTRRGVLSARVTSLKNMTANKMASGKSGRLIPGPST